MEIKIKKIFANATMPTRGSEYAAGYDLYAAPVLQEGDHSIIIEPHTTEKIGTGIAVQCPTGTFGAIFARSGLATKQGLRPANCVGVVDEDYTGEVIVAIHNDTDQPKEINYNERIAQIVFIPYISGELVEVEELEKTNRGDCGFGSTGK